MHLLHTCGINEVKLVWKTQNKSIRKPNHKLRTRPNLAVPVDGGIPKQFQKNTGVGNYPGQMMSQSREVSARRLLMEEVRDWWGRYGKVGYSIEPMIRGSEVQLPTDSEIVWALGKDTSSYQRCKQWYQRCQ